MSSSVSTNSPSGPDSDVVSAGGVGFDAPVESNRQRKRNKRREQKKEKWLEGKRKKASHSSSSSPASTDGVSRNPVRRERNAMMRADTEAKALMSPLVLFDCEFRAQMHTRENISLAQQLMFCYGANKKCEWPLRLVTACPLDGDMHQHLKKNSGLANWTCFTMDHRPLSTICAEERQQQFVYLTADSEDTMWSFEPNVVYIIGGLVDKNRHKNITKDKAAELGLRTARLPLGEVVDMGEHSKVLTVNHVLEIMANLWQRQRSKKSVTAEDWREVCLECLPGRKKVDDREEGGSPEAKRQKVESPAPAAAAAVEGEPVAPESPPAGAMAGPA
ncbi:tRNA methyltransferase 10 [Perkinsus olseni]|uniref:tRNA (guanine(9)-N(1))-methyltransferase n=2 Tax=Perkinsus olseni TaxID=32597 RepID=A0A7J6T5I4_PEROL|nr:tRNA methyltransferase 10 [Perkinsus olseni]